MWFKDVRDAASRVMDWMGGDCWMVTITKIQPTSGGIVFTLSSDRVILWREGSDDVFGYWGDWRGESGWESDYKKWKEMK